MYDKLKSSGINAVKGILILLIVIGHNTLIVEKVPHVFPALYYFHVYAFLLIPFLYPVRPLSGKFVGDRSIRYLVPHIAFYTLAAVAFLVIYKTRFPQWMGKYTIGLVISSARACDNATGFQLYFFLPTLLFLNIALSLYKMIPTLYKVLFAIVSVFLHLYIGVLPDVYKYYIPFGLPIIIYLFPIGLLTRRLWDIVYNYKSTALSIIMAVLAIVIIVFCRYHGTYVNLAYLKLYGIEKPQWMVVHDFLPIVCFFAILLNSTFLAKIPFLSELGRYSLVIFLTHSLFYQFILRIVLIFWRKSSNTVSSAIILIVTLLLTLILSYLTGYLINRVSILQKMITPRSADQWMIMPFRKKEKQHSHEKASL